MNHKTNGFTLVELMLSMAFISVLLIVIAMCVIQMSTIYNRGETLRQVNQASRTLAASLQETIGSADPSVINIDRVETHGRLCTGQFSYIWNSVNPDGSNRYPNNRYTGSGSGTFRFIRVTDVGGAYCRSGDGNAHINRDTAHPVELLAEGDRSLLVHRLRMTPSMAGSATNQQLYTMSVMLGTENIQEIDTTTDGCRPPSELSGNEAYCAVNEFSLTIRAGIG